MKFETNQEVWVIEKYTERKTKKCFSCGGTGFLNATNNSGKIIKVVCPDCNKGRVICIKDKYKPVKKTISSSISAGKHYCYCAHESYILDNYHVYTTDADACKKYFSINDFMYDAECQEIIGNTFVSIDCIFATEQEAIAECKRLKEKEKC